MTVTHTPAPDALTREQVLAARAHVIEMDQAAAAGVVNGSVRHKIVPPHPCRHCGAIIEGRTASALYCGRPCKEAARHAAIKKSMNRTVRPKAKATPQSAMLSPLPEPAAVPPVPADAPAPTLNGATSLSWIECLPSSAVLVVLDNGWQLSRTPGL